MNDNPFPLSAPSVVEAIARADAKRAETEPVRVSQELADMLRAVGGDLRVFDNPMALARALQREHQRDTDEYRRDMNLGGGDGT